MLRFRMTAGLVHLPVMRLCCWRSKNWRTRNVEARWVDLVNCSFTRLCGLNMRNMYPERKPNFLYAGLLSKKGGTPQLSLVEGHTVDVQNLVHCDVVLKQFADLRSSAHGRLMIWGGGLGLRVSLSNNLSQELKPPGPKPQIPILRCLANSKGLRQDHIIQHSYTMI